MTPIGPSSRLPFRTFVLGTAITGLCGGAGVTARPHGAGVASHEQVVSTHHTTPTLGASAQAKARYGELPLSFEANRGQSDSGVSFLSRGSGYSLYLRSTEAVLVLNQPEADESRKSLSSGAHGGAGQA